VRLLRPDYLWLALLVVPVVLLHLRWRRRRRVEVAALTVWREVVKAGAGRSGLRRLRDAFAMVASCLAVLALAVAAAEPVTGQDAPPARSRVIVLDTSLSMSMRDDGERSRLDVALGVARDALEGLGPRDDVTVWTAGERPRVLVGPTRSIDEVRAALDGVTTGLGPRTLGATVDAADRALALRRRDAKVLVISDAPKELPLPYRLFTIGCRVGPVPIVVPRNASLLAVRVNGYALHADVFAGVRRSVPLYVVAASGGEEVARAAVPASLRSLVELSLPPDVDGHVELRLDPPDGFTADDTQSVFIARPRPLVVLVRAPGAAPSVYLTAALGSLPDQLIDRERALVTGLHAAEDVLRAADVVVTESGPGDPAPRPVPAGIATLTFGAAGAETPDPRLSAVAGHPVVEGVVPGPVRAPSARLLALRDGERVLLTCDDGPVAVAGRAGGVRHVRLGLLPVDGTFALEGAFPILVRNALTWLRDHRALPPALAAGDPVPLRDSVPDGVTSVELRGPGGVRTVDVAPDAPLPVAARDSGGGLLAVHVRGDPQPLAATAVQWTPPEGFTLGTGEGGVSPEAALAELPDRRGAVSTLRRHDRWFALAGALFTLLGALFVGRRRHRRPAPRERPDRFDGLDPMKSFVGLPPAGLQAARPKARVQ